MFCTLDGVNASHVNCVCRWNLDRVSRANRVSRSSAMNRKACPIGNSFDIRFETSAKRKMPPTASLGSRDNRIDRANPCDFIMSML